MEVNWQEKITEETCRAKFKEREKSAEILRTLVKNGKATKLTMAKWNV